MISIISIFFVGSIWTLPVSELAGMHQMDEGMINVGDNKPTNLTICKDKKDGALIGDEHDRTLFYECSNGLAFPFHCPPGLIFDDTRGTCTFDPDASTKKPPYHGNSKFNCTGKEDDFYPDEKDATKFHECVNGYPYDFECPPNTVFDAKRKACAFRSAEQSLQENEQSQPQPQSQEQHRQARDVTESTTTVMTEQSTDQSVRRHRRNDEQQQKHHHQLEEIAKEKNIDLHIIETTTPENFDVWID